MEGSDDLLGEAWAAAWLDGVASGAKTMSQRKLSSIDARSGGIERVARMARERGVHLIVLTDDQGERLVAASAHPFQVVC